MNGVLLTAGVVAILAAVRGGGLSAFDLTVPVIESRAKQLSAAARSAARGRPPSSLASAGRP